MLTCPSEKSGGVDLISMLCGRSENVTAPFAFVRRPRQSDPS